MISAQAAKKLANAHLLTEGSNLVVSRASRDKAHNVWVVSYCDPDHPNEMLEGGALVVTDEGDVQGIGSTPDALNHLMEGLALLADGDPDEVPDVAAIAASRRPWSGVLDEELAKPYFMELLTFIDRERRTGTGAVYPSPGDLFAAFRLTPYEKVKVVILGQDPYHQPGQANGLCFSVPQDAVKLPPSLRNIHTALARDGFTPPPHGDLTEWARQGVLLLNTALSVRDSEPNSHAVRWRTFTDAVISKLNDRHTPVVFVLWGRSAAGKRHLIDEDRHVVVTAPHPAARGRFQTEFRDAGTFAKVNRRLEDLKVPPVRWSIP